MSRTLFKLDGPNRVRQTGRDEYTMNISIPADDDGLVARECPSAACRPAYFKVKLGTGITEGQTTAFCPYCRKKAEPSDFFTRSQMQYVKDAVFGEVHQAVEKTIEDALGLGPTRKKRYGDGFFSMEMSYKPDRPPPLRRPIEEELRRDVNCPNCGLDHAVFGLAVWCPDCGTEIFMTHVAKEYESLTASLDDVARRRAELGPRVTARDVENALEDAVSIFEAVLGILTRRALRERGMSESDVDDLFRKEIGNRFQNVERASELCVTLLDLQLLEGFSDEEAEFLRVTFEKRHPITHNLGIVDRKYLDRVRTGELVGRDIPVTSQDVTRVVELSLRVFTHVYQRAIVDRQPDGTQVSEEPK